ncbi:hypothetical protein HPB52_010405 [Rhipicephalus sanguineus]|uniref:Uncharacterized protein n=1 Tax=Rhipicephalus sanguineus TaxID=34632 RepID=A0A9D4PGJ4_RHISA|nr:hypothetical protein HPB52_010405 [Rhipicephalus sanguineus]
MTLMQLLLVQVSLLLFSTVHFEAAEHGARPFSSDPWIASTVSRLSSTRVNGSSSVVRGMCGPSHGWISQDQPIAVGQQNSRGADQAYIGTQHDGFVGFGAGTLADMTLMQLLLVQKRPPRKNGVLVPETRIRIPEKISQVLNKGPKFSHEPSLRPQELLAMNRRISGKAVKEDQERCLLEGVDVITGVARGGGLKTRKDPTACVVTFFKGNDLRLFPKTS